jgi:hypothetical protein
MSRRFRRFLFYSAVAIFILVTPPVVLYALGYSFDFQKWQVVTAGGIYLKSTPSAAQITLEDKDAGLTNRLISRLSPRNYNVVVSKDGYFAWQKKLEVRPQLVTEARNIFLFPKQVNPGLVAQNATSALSYFLLTDSEKENQSQAQLIASSTAGWFLNNDQIFYISEINFNLYQQSLNGSNNQQISQEPLPASHYQIFTNNGARFLILSDIGNFYYLDKTNGVFQPIAQGIKGVELATDNKKFLYWSANEIWVYFLDKILIQPYRQVGEKELITRYAQKISQAIFYPNNEYIAFVVGDQIKITELDGRDQRNTIDLILVPSPQIFFDQNNNYFYYLTNNLIFRLGLE